MSHHVDVPMADGSAAAEPGLQPQTTTPTFPSHQYIYVAIDTNVLISHLDLVKKVYLGIREQATTKVKRPTETQPAANLVVDEQKEMCLLLPCIVLDELDSFKLRGPSRPVQLVDPSDGKASQISEGCNGSLALSMHCPGKNKKHNTGQGDLKSSAREAVAWLFEVLRAEEQRQIKAEKKKPSSPKAEFLRSIRFQKRDEKMGIGILNLPKKADTEILDCCRYFSSAFQGGSQVVLWTNDRNLRLQAEVHDVPTVGHPLTNAKGIIKEVKQRIDATREQQPSAAELLDENSKHALSAVDDRPPVVKELTKKQRARARKAQIKADAANLAIPHPTLRNMDSRLSQILPLQLYSFLLSRLFDNDPIRLRGFLTSQDPGPGVWDTRHCLHLLERAWSGVSMVLQPELLTPMWEAISWLKGFWEWYADPSRAHLRPGLATTTHVDVDGMHIDDHEMEQADEAVLRSDWNQAGQALSLIFGGWIEEEARQELRVIIEWMTGGTHDS